MFARKNRDYDLAIIGGGSAAFAAAIRAAEADARVLIVEKETIGGTCVNRGCVPSKNILHAAELYHGYHVSAGFPGLPSGDEPAGFADIFQQKEDLVKDLQKSKYLDILRAFPSIKMVNANAHFADQESLRVNGDRVHADMFLVATGAKPFIPNIAGLENVPFWTYREALSPDKQPKSLVILGGGPIGLELGQAYARLGTRVSIIESMPRLLPGFDPEIGDAMQSSLEQEGLQVFTHTRVNTTRKTSNGIAVEALDNDSKKIEIECETLLIATGVVPNTAELGAADAGFELTEKGAVRVNEYLRTKNKRVFSAGDVTGTNMLVTAAAQQGGIAVENGLLGRKEKFDGSLVPRAVFTTPQAAAVGLSESDARAKGMKVVTAVLDFEHVPRAAAIRDPRGVLKLIVDEKSSRIIGLQAACSQAAEIAHAGLFIIKGRMTVGDVLRTSFIYPTMSEAIKIAAISLRKDVTKLSCCAS